MHANRHVFHSDNQVHYVLPEAFASTSVVSHRLCPKIIVQTSHYDLTRQDRTIPANGFSTAFSELGDVPLGLHVFHAPTTRRDLGQEA